MNSPLVLQLFEGIKLEPQRAPALYLQLTQEILALIKNGYLTSGQKLPSTRVLVGILGLNRLTIAKAYEELLLQGWLFSKIGSGTYVVDHIPEMQAIPLAILPGAQEGIVTLPKISAENTDTSQKQQEQHPTITNLQAANRSSKPVEIPPFDYLQLPSDMAHCALHLDDGFPDPKLAPLTELYRSYRNQLTRGGFYEKFGKYSSPSGSIFFRETLSTYLNQTRALHSTAAEVLSVNGTVMALNLICNTLLSPGDTVLLGIPTWGRALQNFQHAGAHILPITVDQQGVVVDEIENILKSRTVKMIYLTPHHHYPTTVSLPLERRLKLLELAHRYGFYIVEDDYDFDFHYARRPILPLASVDQQDRVIYCGSFSKSLSPAFRLGYIVAAAVIIQQLSKVRAIIDRQGDQILDNALASLLQDGTIQRYHRKALACYKIRRDLLHDSLRMQFQEQVQFSKPEGGLAIWVNFDAALPVQSLAHKARLAGLYISDGTAHQYPNFACNAIRLGFASVNDKEIEQSIALLKKLSKEIF